ncbi:FecR family protein [Aquiflexum balticum DSM 16537]|uniref:FecR family protein n=1 Tax=Aquiflexum balticum DSM 16537 TaxID=758820 RepID=A0A1W2H652_9BACT|nr:FecR family protein [Aquiflexum balticum]SMD44420.1 FecR family protein [Aquiflexum balticum DSM 16537]
MKFKDYDIEHFLTDEFFIQWVKNPNENNQHFWEKWISEHPEKRKVVQQAASVIRSIQSNQNTGISDALYVDMFENIIKAEEKKMPVKPKPDESNSWFSIFSIRKIAATVVIGFCIWISYDVMVKGVEIQTEIPKTLIVSRSNPAGKKSIISLSEGTKIHLNGESKIAYPEVFEKDQRKVELVGEAYFEVAKDGRPFIVSVGDNAINVLGTSFNVRQNGAGGLAVALVEGKVKVNDRLGNQVLLNPNEMLVIEETGKFYKSDFDLMEITGWKDMYLIFNSDSFEEAKSKIENWYGVEIEVKGKISETWVYSGQYKEESLENVLRGISLTSGLKYTIKGRKVTITKP